ncbi:hypothetical protein KJ567_02550 [Candidatus Bipolaricaulota bacterium]|nr:hypothetical protein [Candidatus Bipolaricaulota bacterium]
MSQTLTIARALRQAKKLKGQVAILDRRLGTCASWREDREADFDFSETLQERNRKVEELTVLRTGIARANASASVAHRGREMSLTEAILRMGELKGLKKLYAGLQLRRETEREYAGYDDDGRQRHVQLTWTSVWSEAERAGKLDEIQEEIDELNEALEEANHRTPVSLAS